LEINKIKIEPSEDTQIIIAQSHFIKTVEDVYECLMNCVPNIKFGLAFCEASGQCLVRYDGNDEKLKKESSQYAYSLSAGHSLIILIKNAFPINVLSMLRSVPEIVNIYCATANPIEIIYVETNQGRGIIGIVDGYKPKGIEDEKNITERKNFLREIGYKT
jgi:adenosine/AMP kinase